MPRPAYIPEKGDVIAAKAAARLGMGLGEFEDALPRLIERGFPPPDPDTGRYSIEAIDRWRLNRHRHLFPELTAPAEPRNADDALRRIREARRNGQGQDTLLRRA